MIRHVLGGSGRIVEEQWPRGQNGRTGTFPELVREAAADCAQRATRGLLLGLLDMDRVVRAVSDDVGGFGRIVSRVDRSRWLMFSRKG